MGEPVWIAGPAGALQGITACPPEGRPMHGIGVICHPHPLYGGTLHNKVVDALSRTLNDLGVGTLRFNFRGVEASEGDYAQGIGEADDLRAVLRWAQGQRPGHPLWLAGFSFGAYVALRVAHEFPLTQLITVAPPVNFFDFSALTIPQCPWLLAQGEADEIVPSEQVFAWAQHQDRVPDIIRMPDVGHFFHGNLNRLREQLIEHIPLSRAMPAT
ncbi:MAG: alpha/beta hydrolase [Gammaproteobacteria bacterium]|nr:alpha/beta hydrolase [Gammaproteobacteria bacterium]